MIKLVVAPYCDDCMHFKPKAKTTCHYMLDNLCTSVMTVVECENADKCEEISKTIAKRYGMKLRNIYTQTCYFSLIGAN